MAVSLVFQEVEDKWLSKIAEEVRALFADIWLPSHDHIHHLRVWAYAKELVRAYEQDGLQFSFDYVEALFFACLFHDTGLSVTLDESHGKESRKLMETYIEENQIEENSLTSEMLDAIELHDDKTYKTNKTGNLSSGLYQVLTVADDLDAMGALGLYRYFEIYFGRGIGIGEVQGRVEQNIKLRIKFIKSNLEFNPQLFERHYERYQRAYYYLKLLSEEELTDINDLIEREVKPSQSLLLTSFSYSTKLHDFLTEVVVEEASLIN